MRPPAPTCRRTRRRTSRDSRSRVSPDASSPPSIPWTGDARPEPGAPLLNDPDKPFAPAAERNKAAILAALRDELAEGDRVLELGSGTGQHLVHFAEALPAIDWQPSDLRQRLPGIRRWVEECGRDNLLPPIELDLATSHWTDTRFDVCYTANTLHIVSWPLVNRLFAGCADVLVGNGRLCVYGPFAVDGKHVHENNRRFDEALRADRAESGIRDRTALDELAVQHGFAAARVVAMPANNHLLVYRSS